MATPREQRLRALATSDLHYPWRERGMGQVAAMGQRAMESQAGVLILGGDNGEPDGLYAFEHFPGKKLIIAGNHDLYTKTDDSLVRYRGLEEAYRQFGFHFLDAQPAIVNGVGFAGNVGWYDYSFRRTEPLPEDPECPLLINGKRLHELTEEDYARQTFRITEGRRTYTASWEDRANISWGITDKEFLDRCLDKLEGDLSQLEREVDKICAVVHHLPFDELVKHDPNDIALTLTNAYMGSTRIGELLLAHPKVRTVITGHTHRPGKYSIHGLDVYNVSRRPRSPGFTNIPL